MKTFTWEREDQASTDNYKTIEYMNDEWGCRNGRKGLDEF